MNKQSNQVITFVMLVGSVLVLATAAIYAAVLTLLQIARVIMSI